MVQKARNLVFMQLVPLFSKRQTDITTPITLPKRNSKNTRLRRQKFKSSSSYLEKRYRREGTGGKDKKLLRFKANVLNSFVEFHQLKSVVDFGCGNGNQVAFFNFPKYKGYDINSSAVHICARRFAYEWEKSFSHLSAYSGKTHDLSISLEVVYYLVEEKTYECYMTRLFDASHDFVIIFSSNHENDTADAGVKHRRFTDWVAINRPDFKLVEHIPNIYPEMGELQEPAYADFYVYKKIK